MYHATFLLRGDKVSSTRDAKTGKKVRGGRMYNTIQGKYQVQTLYCICVGMYLVCQLVCNSLLWMDGKKLPAEDEPQDFDLEGHRNNGGFLSYWLANLLRTGGYALQVTMLTLYATTWIVFYLDDRSDAFVYGTGSSGSAAGGAAGGASRPQSPRAGGMGSKAGNSSEKNISDLRKQQMKERLERLRRKTGTNQEVFVVPGNGSLEMDIEQDEPEMEHDENMMVSDIHTNNPMTISAIGRDSDDDDMNASDEKAPLMINVGRFPSHSASDEKASVESRRQSGMENGLGENEVEDATPVTPMTSNGELTPSPFRNVNQIQKKSRFSMNSGRSHESDMYNMNKVSSDSALCGRATTRTLVALAFLLIAALAFFFGMDFALKNFRRDEMMHNGFEFKTNAADRAHGFRLPEPSKETELWQWAALNGKGERKGGKAFDGALNVEGAAANNVDDKVTVDKVEVDADGALVISRAHTVTVQHTEKMKALIINGKGDRTENYGKNGSKNEENGQKWNKALKTCEALGFRCERSMAVGIFTEKL